MVDLYTAHSFPQECINMDFFDRCKALLLPEGIIAVNLANRKEQWPVFKILQECFQGCTVALPVSKTSNMIILGYCGEKIQPLLELVKKHQKLKHLSWDTKWGYIAQF
jgi:spermidine synthase